MHTPPQCTASNSSQTRFIPTSSTFHFVNSHFVNSHFVNSHLVNFPLRQFPFGQLSTSSIPIWSTSHFVNSHFVNSHLVNVDKVGIDEVGSWQSGNCTLKNWKMWYCLYELEIHISNYISLLEIEERMTEELRWRPFSRQHSWSFEKSNCRWWLFCSATEHRQMESAGWNNCGLALKVPSAVAVMKGFLYAYQLKGIDSQDLR